AGTIGNGMPGMAFGCAGGTSTLPGPTKAPRSAGPDQPDDGALENSDELLLVCATATCGKSRQSATSATGHSQRPASRAASTNPIPLCMRMRFSVQIAANSSHGGRLSP